MFERLEKFFGPDNIDTVAIIGKKFHVDNDPPYRGTFEEWTTLVSKRLREIRKTYPNAKIEPDPAVYQEGGRIVEKDGRQIVEIPGKPWYRTSKHLDLWVNGLEENEKVAERAVAELEKRKDHRFFFFIHFAEPDHRGHKFGENSQEYTDGFKLDDQYSGWIINKLKVLGLYDNTWSMSSPIMASIKTKKPTFTLRLSSPAPTTQRLFGAREPARISLRPF